MQEKSQFFEMLLVKIEAESYQAASPTSDWKACVTSTPLFFQYVALMRFVFGCFKRDILFTITFGCFVAALSLLIPMVSGYVFSHIHTIENGGFVVLFICFLSAFIANSVFSCINEMNIKTLNLKLLVTTMPSFWMHLLRLPLKTIQQFVSGELSQKIFDYELALSTLLSISLSILFCVVSLVCLLGYMAYCSMTLAVIYLGICMFFLMIKLYFVPASFAVTDAMLAKQGSLTQYVNEVLLQIQKIRSAGCEGRVFKRWLKQLVAVKVLTEKSVKIETFIQAAESLIPAILMLMLLTNISLSSGKLDTYMLLQFMICAGQFTGIFNKLSTQLLSLVRILPSLHRLQSLMLAKKEPYDESKKVPHGLHGSISLSDISLHHAETGVPILANITMQLPAGRFIAIVGQSGAGKSSLFKLLLGFEAATAGRISIDQQDMSNFNLSDIRSQYGVVLQTTNLLPGTIFSNLAANTAITLDEAWRLAEIVGLTEEINAMPMKMHTFLSDNAGESISGGQKQKILIARALASKPKILLLDEATSALDNHSQAHIFNNLKQMNMTRVVIAHRYSTIVDADIIYRLEKGRLVASGTYDEVIGQPCAV